ncbi:AAC(3) family N-acetyltransferase, partial [Streptomyces globisporus]|uniref:AAC(3) family N-acetyltransferase n=1 Tax=Streptomyces globisporus TaxID=1908 RepID=UPI0036FFA2EE
MKDVLDVTDRAGATAALTALGVRPGDVLLVHASLRSLGAVAGRARGVLDAVRRAVGPAGTVVVPAFTPENSDTSPHYRERVRGLDAGAVDAVRAAMPAYDPALTPAPSMGALAETVRTTAGAERSAHPQTSFAALGPGGGGGGAAPPPPRPRRGGGARAPGVEAAGRVQELRPRDATGS